MTPSHSTIFSLIRVQHIPLLSPPPPPSLQIPLMIYQLLEYLLASVMLVVMDFTNLKTVVMLCWSLQTQTSMNPSMQSIGLFHFLDMEKSET